MSIGEKIKRLQATHKDCFVSICPEYDATVFYSSFLYDIDKEMIDSLTMELSGMNKYVKDKCKCIALYFNSTKAVANG
jgi:hypothetical protein